MKKISAALIVITALICSPYAYAAESDIFTGTNDYTLTKNEYHFDCYNAVLVDNKEVIDDIDFDEFNAGSDLYIPIGVYPDGGNTPQSPAPDKMVKTDNVTVSSKITVGGEYVDEISLVDTKKLKIDGLPAGMYVHVPFSDNYQKFTRSRIKFQLVLAVNGEAYQNTIVYFEGFIINRIVDIKSNSVYGAMIPTQFKVTNYYSGDVTFDFGEGVTFATKVKKEQRFYLSLSREPDAAISSMYSSDKKTFLEYYNFLGDEDSFSYKGNLQIPVKKSVLSSGNDAPSLYVYRVNGDVLTSLGADIVSYDARKERLNIKTSSLDYYIISNKALKQNIEDPYDEDDILKTGYDTAIAQADQEEYVPQGTGTAQPAQSSAASGSPAPQPAPAAGLSDEEYVPDEGGFVNGNPQTGPAINADNVSSDNPSTSDISFVLAVAACIISAFTAITLFRSEKK